MHLLRNYFVFNYTPQSDPNEKTFWTMYSTPGRGQIESKTISTTLSALEMNPHTVQWVDYLSYKYIF